MIGWIRIKYFCLILAESFEDLKSLVTEDWIQFIFNWLVIRIFEYNYEFLLKFKACVSWTDLRWLFFVFRLNQKLSQNLVFTSGTLKETLKWGETETKCERDFYTCYYNCLKILNKSVIVIDADLNSNLAHRWLHVGEEVNQATKFYTNYIQALLRIFDKISFSRESFSGTVQNLPKSSWTCRTWKTFLNFKPE